MAQNIMGEVFGKNTSRLRTVILVAFILLAVSGVHASYREFELFDKGYEYYLSYQPEKAAEEFRLFLQEFPDSSAKDAAMFWLGKSLLQLKSIEETKKVFSDLKQQYRESHFVAYVDKELETIRRLESESYKGKTTENDAVKIHSVPETKLEEVEKKTKAAENDLSKAMEDRDKLKLSLDEERKKTEVLQARVNDLEAKAIEVTKKVQDTEEDQSKAIEERDKLKLFLDEEKKKAEVLQARVKELEGKEAVIIDSSILLNKLGIKEVIWSSGNAYEDMKTEQILYEKAKSINVSIDTTQYRELVQRYQLNTGQADYLYRYLTISGFIDRKLEDMPGEKMVESLIVKYEERNRYRKIVLSTELQTQAKNGISFEEIQKLYPDFVKFTTVGFQELEGRIKEKIQFLQNNEIGVIWSEEGYMILKPVLKKLSFKPFEEILPEIKNKIKSYIKEWVNELKEETDGTKIQRTG